LQHTHTHTHKSKSDVGEDKKQRSTGKERQGEILTAGNRRRGANDNVEYDWGRFMEFLQKLSAWSDRFLLHPHSAMTDDFYSNTVCCVTVTIASNKTPWVERIGSFTVSMFLDLCVFYTTKHTHLLYQH